MKTTSIHSMDDLRRVLIPNGLRNQTGFNIGDRLTALVNHVDKTVTLFKFDGSGGGELTLDALGRVTLDNGYVNSLGWGKRDKLTVTLGTGGITIALAMHQKACA